jgi:putative methyltransferase (TIGR04325 family)
VSVRLVDFVPPVLTSLVRRARTAKASAGVVFPSYVAALRACEGTGYEESDIVRVVFEKTVAYRDLLERTPTVSVSSTEAFGLVSIAYHWARVSNGEKQRLNVIDFGGACGMHYFAFRKVLGPEVALRWFVVETTAMHNMGRQLENRELRFFDDLAVATAEIGDIDLLYTSGTIQCVERPYHVLGTIRDSRPRLVLFNRLALTLNNDDLVTLHKSMLSWHGIGPLPAGFVDREVRYPYTFLAKRKFDESFSGYRVAIEFDDKSGVHPVGSEPVIGLGRLFERL